MIAKPIADLFKSDEFKFHTGGREDIDVRMLGSGRPFVVELMSPRLKSILTQETLSQIEKHINLLEVSVCVSNLQFTDDGCFGVLTEAAAAKVKVYGAILQSSAEITDDMIAKVNSINNLEIDQMTPLRVLHRRTLMTRDKFVYRAYLDRINKYTGLLFLLTSAGTYIKEFVHGDLNRTVPNMGMILGCKCDIIQLDVMDLYSDYSQESVQKYEELVDKIRFKN